MDLEERVREDRPLRAIWLLVNEALASLERGLRGAFRRHRLPSIAPEKLLRAMLLQAFYSVRSEHLLDSERNHAQRELDRREAE